MRTLPSFLTERFPTEIRATTSAFCFHHAAVFGGLIAPGLTYLAIGCQPGFATPMLVASTLCFNNVCASSLLSPETRSVTSNST